MYFLGIDGGGTKTRYIIANEHLDVLANIEGGTTHIHQIGKKGLKEELVKNIDIICKSKGIEKTDIGFAFLGIPGYGESEVDKKNIDEIVSSVLTKTLYKIDNDVVVGWASATLCKPGVNIVSGTGSIAFGIDEFGNSGRSGGWGPVIGDEGSAYWIGVKTIEAYTKQKDGREKKTILVDMIEREYNITYNFEITEIIFNKMKLSRAELAKFSRICSMAAEKGCEKCKGILKNAAYELYLNVIALDNKLSFKDKFIVSYTGGVFKAGDLILEPLKEYLKDLNCEVIPPILEPWYGAVLLAYTLGGNKLTDKDVLKLKGEVYEKDIN
ncbi:MAG: BadF/BadG/BcrA/BcrD ATPase family protein [Clostridium sp.]|uniref:N-acetylglucosamine kinase n=1 Tax=Clostridium sp. TaxID=1506 RepID=UPI002910A334|nr:BadF/BadG/BcrA/BcrD ATPase family protein [Clostridium sp.]MDU5109946.1 BadF/BadG/BcrA/BcrD ATPase family protein [Clostridium sp.]